MDTATQDYLEMVSILFRDSFFQDLPYVWQENPVSKFVVGPTSPDLKHI